MKRILAVVLSLAATPTLAAPGDWVNGVLPVATAPALASVDLPVTLRRANPAQEAWAQQTPDQRLVYNVSKPQLIVWPSSLPADADAPAVLLVPGGGFQFLAMDNEGFDVARRLDKLGVRVFIVKYRTQPVPDSIEGFRQALGNLFQKGAPVDLTNRDYAVADTQGRLFCSPAHRDGHS